MDGHRFRSWSAPRAASRHGPGWDRRGSPASWTRYVLPGSVPPVPEQAARLSYQSDLTSVGDTEVLEWFSNHGYHGAKWVRAPPPGCGAQELSQDPLGILRPSSKLQHGLPLCSAYAALAASPQQRGDPPEVTRQRRRCDAKHNEPKCELPPPLPPSSLTRGGTP